jgi:hypothetical protein
MSAALDLIRAVEANGGHIRIDGEYLVIAPGNAAEPVMEELRQHKAEIIGLLQNRLDSPVEGTQDVGSGLWLLERCVYRDRWWGGTAALHLDRARWCADHGRRVPVSRRAFVTGLQAEGFQVTPDGLVYGLILRDDLEAHERFQSPPRRPAISAGAAMTLGGGRASSR